MQLFEDTDEFLEFSPPQAPPGPQPREAFTVYIPGWEDIIHVYPEGLLPYNQQLALKRERARRIAESPTPEIVRSIGSILTWIDDIQDALVTLSVAGRIVARTAPRLLPYVGWVATAADALNVLNIWGLTGMLGKSGKRQLRNATAGSPWSQKARLAKAVKTGKVLPNVAEWLQILQTTDTLFGLGISLGPLIGFYEDIYFSLARGEPVKWESPLPNEYHMAAFKVFKASGPLSLVYNDLSDRDRETVHVATRLAWAMIQDFLPKTDWGATLAPHLERYIKPPGPRNELTLNVINELRLHSSNPGPWPLPGSPYAVNLQELQKHIQEKAGEYLFGFLKDKRKTLQGKAHALLSSDIAYLALRGIQDEPGDLEVLEADTAKAAWHILHYDLLGRERIPPERGIPKLQQLARKMSETGLNALPYWFVREIWQK